MPAISFYRLPPFPPAHQVPARRVEAPLLGAEDDKNAARQRIQLIKERILALRQLLAMSGGRAAAALQELRQLAGELKTAAAVLASDAGQASLPFASPANDGLAAYAEQQRIEHTQDRATSGQPVGAPADERLVEAVRKLLAATAEQARLLDHDRRKAGSR